MPEGPPPPAGRKRGVFSTICFALFVGLFVPMILMNFAFYRLGSPTPDPATGRTYPVQEHGILYVVPWQGELAQALFWAAGAVFPVFFFSRRSEWSRGKDDVRPWSKLRSNVTG
jgi:hypothetical protein